MVLESSNIQNYTNEQILFIFQEELLKNVKKDFHGEIKEGKPLKSDFLLVKADPEPYTRKIIESQIKKFFPEIDSLPHNDTLYRLLKKIDVDQIEHLLLDLFRSLVKKKKFCHKT